MTFRILCFFWCRRQFRASLPPEATRPRACGARYVLARKALGLADNYALAGRRSGSQARFEGFVQPAQLGRPTAREKNTIARRATGSKFSSEPCRIARKSTRPGPARIGSPRRCRRMRFDSDAFVGLRTCLARRLNQYIPRCLRLVRSNQPPRSPIVPGIISCAGGARTREMPQCPDPTARMRMVPARQSCHRC